MAQFEKAIDHLLEQEGSAFTNDPNDAGGATKWGITLNDLKAHGVDLNHDGKIDVADVQGMSHDEAVNHYHLFYWNPVSLDLINSQAIASKTFSTGVNMGLKMGPTFLQRAANALNAGLVEDGNLGPKSLKTINGLDEKILMDQLVKINANYYWDITAHNIQKNGIVKLKWTPELVTSGLQICQNQDLTGALNLLAMVRKLPAGHLEGNIRFIKGWLNRAAERYGV